MDDRVVEHGIAESKRSGGLSRFRAVGIENVVDALADQVRLGPGHARREELELLLLTAELPLARKLAG
jgi:hypothetical protein